MKFNTDKSQFLQGITFNPEIGMNDMRGIDPYRELGYMAGGWKSVSVTTGTISSTISHIVVDNETDLDTSIAWLVANNKVSRYYINTGTIIDETSTSANYGAGGAALMSKVLYIGGDGSSDNIGKLTVDGGNIGTWTGGHFSTKQTDYKEMIKYSDAVYGCNKDSLFKITDSATFAGSELVLESNTTAVSLAPYGEFIVTGALLGRYFPSNAAGTGDGLFRSRLYFWQPDSSTWDKDRSTTIEGRILKVLNKKGVLYVFIKENSDAVSINYFDGNTIQPLKRITINTGTNVIAPDQGAYDVKGDQIYFGLSDTGSVESYSARVMAYGSGYPSAPVALTNPLSHPSVAPSNVSTINSLAWTKPDELLMSITDTGSNHTLKAFKPANGYYAYTLKTPSMSTGDKQWCDNVKVNFKRLSTNDKFNVHRNIDNAGFESSVWASASYSRNGAIDNLIIKKEFEFNNLEIRIDGNRTSGGNTRIKNIIVNSYDMDTK